MKKQMVKTISILSLLITLSVSAVNVPASGGTCSVPSCRPKRPIAQNLMEEPAEDRSGQEKMSNVQLDDSFNITLFLEQLAMSFLSLR